MITSKGRFLIATPTKTGTTTLEELARRVAGGRLSRGGVWREEFRIMDWEFPRRQHRMALPPMRDVDKVPWGDVERYLLVRNPYMRYLSMYMYLSERRNLSQFGARELQESHMTFDEWLRWLAATRQWASSPYAVRRRGDLRQGRAYRAPWVWTDPQCKSQRLLGEQRGKQFGQVRILRLETLWRDLGPLLARHRLDVGRLGGIHANKTKSLQDMGPSAAYRMWGGVEHGRGVFRQDGVFRGWQARVPGCVCGACALDVGLEAQTLGY